MALLSATAVEMRMAALSGVAVLADTRVVADGPGYGVSRTSTVVVAACTVLGLGATVLAGTRGLADGPG